MCLIIIKKAGVKMVDNEILKNSWNNNSDGAGFMYLDNGQVKIQKGFMKFKDLKNALGKIKNIDDIPLIIHLRITTHGGTSQSNTHPFPLSSSIKELRALQLNTSIGIAHNGIINISNDKKLSDTMQYIKDELSLFNTIKPDWYKDIKSLDFIQSRITSKLALLDKDGYIATVGEFYEEEGILYSNYSYIGYSDYGHSWKYDNYYILTDSLYSDDITIQLSNLGLLDYEIVEISKMIKESEIIEILDSEKDGLDPLDIILDRMYNHYYYKQ